MMSVNLKLPFEISKKEKWFVASCPVLDVFSQGYTEEEAKSNLSEALSLFFSSCIDRGTLSDVLKECGFKPITTQEQAIPLMFPNKNYLDIPLNLLSEFEGYEHCRA